MTSPPIATSRRLLGAAKRKPSQADLRRTVSTAYYAGFDALCRLCADELVGSSLIKRATSEWTRVYRSLNHGKSESALLELDPKRTVKARQGLPSDIDTEIEGFCETLEKMRKQRNQADYDPAPLKLRRDDVSLLVEEMAVAISGLSTAAPAQRRALAFACVVARRT